MAHVTNPEKHRNGRNHAAHHLPEGTVTDGKRKNDKARRSRRTLVRNTLTKWRNVSASAVIDETENLVFPTEKEIDRSLDSNGHRDLKVRKERVGRLLEKHCDYDIAERYRLLSEGNESLHQAEQKVIRETAEHLRKISSLTEAERYKVAKETFDYITSL